MCWRARRAYAGSVRSLRGADLRRCCRRARRARAGSVRSLAVAVTAAPCGRRALRRLDPDPEDLGRRPAPGVVEDGPEMADRSVGRADVDRGLRGIRGAPGQSLNGTRPSRGLVLGNVESMPIGGARHRVRRNPGGCTDVLDTRVLRPDHRSGLEIRSSPRGPKTALVSVRGHNDSAPEGDLLPHGRIRIGCHDG